MKEHSISSWGDDALGNSDAVDIAARIRKGEVSPGEVIEAAIQRAETVNPQLNALVLETFDSARSQARTLEATRSQGALAGIPTFIKDNSDIAGLPTRHGSRATVNKPAKRNGHFVDQLFSTGMISLGKTTTPEFGIPPTTESAFSGATVNPWHIEHSSGGSSGGSASLVAAGVVPIAHANDGGGSIRIPAACCGLVGLKPTRNRLVNYNGSGALPINVIHEGVVTRTVRDTALFMAEAEKHFRNAKLPELGHVTHAEKKRYRIAVLNAPFPGVNLNPEVARALDQTARICERLGHHVEETPPLFPAQIADDFLDYYASMFFTLTRFGRLLVDPAFDARKAEPFSMEFSARFRKHMLRYPKVLKRLRRGRDVTEKIHDKFDIILCPTTNTPPPRNGYILDPTNGSDAIEQRLLEFVSHPPLQNITGEPAISLPMSMSSEGLPIGMQFSARYGQDGILLRLAYELEEACDWQTLAP